MVLDTNTVAYKIIKVEGQTNELLHKIVKPIIFMNSTKCIVFIWSLLPARVSFKQTATSKNDS